MWVKFASGETLRGYGWENYPKNSTDADSTGVTILVDTSNAQFARIPRYFTSIGGKTHHWALTGATSIYEPTATSFRIYVRYSNGRNLNARMAEEMEWYINWYAIEESTCNGGNPINPVL